MSIADLRKDYQRADLSETDTVADPIAQFQQWFDDALRAEVPEANAMSVATVGEDGRPSSRIVLIKEINAQGFTWFTNYHSRKGRELLHHPFAALLFHWIELERQVRIEGRVERISAEESDAYYYSRPLGSQLGAIASQQSTPVDNREVIQAQLDAVTAEYGDHPVRPEHWGGYRVVPDRIEFWQGRPSRLHDRIVYIKDVDNNWIKQRLQP
jgi:pyridoxamine 5'-phosphate oxidase